MCSARERRSPIVQAFLDAGFQIQRFEELGHREYPNGVALRCLR